MADEEQLANLSGANLYETIFADLDLSSCKGLESCSHSGPSIIDHRTLQRSGPLPLAFLRGVGLPDNLIDYLPSLLNQPIQFYSCFISYSSKDQAFAERLHADLQAKGVRCWFAPHDMQIGAKILDAIDEAIRLRDKVLLVLSEGAIASDWVEGEVTRALDEERERKRPLLFPIRHRRRRAGDQGGLGAAAAGRSATSATSPAGRSTTPTARASSGCCATSRSRRITNPPDRVPPAARRISRSYGNGVDPGIRPYPRRGYREPSGQGRQ